MPPNPADFDVTPEELRKRMNLSDSVRIYQTGVEHIFGNTIPGLSKCYGTGALLLRTFPDFTLYGAEIYFVEAKCRTTSIEAIGLYFNKMRERMGASVLYSFPDVTIAASLIPMELIEVPLKYSKQFTKYLMHLFVEEQCRFNFWSSDPKSGSGDPFVRIEEEDLKILAEGM